jgi:hypothetical protein
MKLTIYRILSFLLLPIALLFSITVLFFIRAAFANPAMLLPLFIVACVTVYSFASLNFLIRGIDGKKFLGRSSKDWLKVNAIVSIIFSVLMISQCIIFILHPEMLKGLAEQAKQNAGSDLKVPEASFENYLLFTSYFFLAYAIVLFIHTILSFQYIRLYNYLFQNEGK